MKRCMGQCKKPSTMDYTPETVVHESGVWIFMLHDTVECPDRIRWRMNSLRAAAQRLRQSKEQ